MKKEMKNKLEAVENFNGYKVFKIIQEGEATFYRCSNLCVSNGWDIDEMTYDADLDEYMLERNCMWCATLKECKSSLSVWAD